MDWLQAHEKAGKNKKTAGKPSPDVLPAGKARVLVLDVCTYDNRLVQAGETLILRNCRREFPRTPLKKEQGYPTVVINGEKFERKFRDGHMEYLGEIKEDADGNETFIPYHGQPIEAAPTALSQGNGQPGQGQGNQGGTGTDKNRV